MKKLLLFAFSICFSTIYAQSTNDFFNNSNATLTFVGLDFSNAKLIGSDGFSDPHKIKDYYFDTWNSLMVSERDKYNIGKAFYKKNVAYRVGVVSDVNEKVKHEDLVTNKYQKSFEKEALQKMVKKYDVSDLETTYGISFIVHSFNKQEEKAYINIVLFDIKTKKVLFSELVTPDARGFGFRNYWAGAIYNLIANAEKKDYRIWRKSVLN